MHSPESFALAIVILDYNMIHMIEFIKKFV